MRDFLLGLKFGISYFTILPVSSFKEDEDVTKKEVLNYSVVTLPFVGLILGCLTLLLYSFLDSIPWLGAILSASFYMILYGFLHTEAILDVVDAIYAKHSGKDAYKVIKESTIGAMGMLYALVFVLAKIAAIVYMFSQDLLLEFLCVLIISRFCTGFNLYFNDFKSSFLSMLKDSINLKYYLIALALFTIFAYFLISSNIFYLLIIGFLLSFFVINSIKKSLGFLNGDALGMTLELVELGLFIYICYFIAI